MTDTRALVPFPADPSELDAYADPGEFVVLACERAKSWLAQALECGDIEAIVETKSQAEAIRVYTAQKQMGHDAELSAAEVVRRAERCIGLAIRKGQEAGEIRRRGQGGGPNATSRSDREVSSPYEFVSSSELEGARGDGIYALTDGVSDDAFDAAIDDARSERNLSRANVVRKVKGEPTEPNRRPKFNPNRALSEALSSLDGIASGLDLVKDYFGSLNPESAPELIDAALAATARIRGRLRAMKEAVGG